MRAQTAVQRNNADRTLKPVPDSGQQSPASEPETAHPPELTVTRVGNLIPGQEYAPVIRLNPRSNHANSPAPQSGNATADVIDIESAEVRRRLLGISRSITQASLEVLAGTRPVNQLSRWLDPASYERLQLRSRMIRAQREKRRAANGAKAARLHRSPQVRSAHLCRISSEVYEASVVVVEQTRVRAVALRLEYRKQLWKVTALEIG